MINIGVSPITNKIYAGKSKEVKPGVRQWVGTKEDVTQDALSAVFQWFENNFEIEKAKMAYTITFEESKYTLMLVKTEDIINIIKTPEQEETE